MKKCRRLISIYVLSTYTPRIHPRCFLRPDSTQICETASREPRCPAGRRNNHRDIEMERTAETPFNRRKNLRCIKANKSRIHCACPKQKDISIGLLHVRVASRTPGSRPGAELNEPTAQENVREESSRGKRRILYFTTSRKYRVFRSAVPPSAP